MKFYDLINPIKYKSAFKIIVKKIDTKFTLSEEGVTQDKNINKHKNPAFKKELDKIENDQ